MTLPLAFVVGTAALICTATVLAEIRLRLTVRRFRSRLEELDARIKLMESKKKRSPSKIRARESERSLERGAMPLARRRVDPPLVSSIEGPSLISIPDIGSRRSAADTSLSNAHGERFSDIWERGELGLSPSQIAKECGIPLGQVELVLGLRELARTTKSVPGGDADRGTS